MAEFKFSCPHCNQHIKCDTGYAGMQINCPACKQAIVVPQAPHSAAAPPTASTPPPPPPPTASPALATRQSTTVAASGRRFAGAPSLTGAPPPKPKSNTLRNVLIIAASVAVLAGLGTGGWILYSKHEAKVEAARGNPEARVPKPTATAAAQALGILEKVHHAYTNLTSLSASGTSMMVVDMSAVTMADVNPNAKRNTRRRPANLPKGITNSTDISIKLARPDLYRIEEISTTEAGRVTMTNTTAVWSSGKTNYALRIMSSGRRGARAFKRYMVVKDRNSALMMGGQAGLAMVIPQLFFNEAGGMNIGKLIKDWGQTGDDSLDGQDCYTLTGKLIGQKLKIWVSKSSYLILQSQITLGAPVSDADFEQAFNMFGANTNLTAKMTPQQIEQQKALAKRQLSMMTKIRGTLTENYDTIETDQTYAPDDFNYPVPRGVRLMPAPF